MKGIWTFAISLEPHHFSRTFKPFTSVICVFSQVRNEECESFWIMWIQCFSSLSKKDQNFLRSASSKLTNWLNLQFSANSVVGFFLKRGIIISLWTSSAICEPGWQNTRKPQPLTAPWVDEKCLSSWWFQTFFIFTPIRGNDPIWLIFFKWVETTN